MIKNSRVAIIIVNWKKYNMTANCIESVIKCNYPNYEIVLVDNESDISKVSIFKSRENVKTILNPKNEGFSKANNQGIEYALDRKSTRLNSSHSQQSRMPSSA